jgi:hypothetical protein
MLAEARAGRETASFSLPWSRVDVEPGDVLAVAGAEWRVARIADGAAREVTAVKAEPRIHLGAPRPGGYRRRKAPALAGPPLAVAFDLASAESDPVALSRIAVTADPWPGGYTLWRSDDGTSFTAEATVATRAVIGRTLAALPAGPLWRFDRRAVLDVELSHGELQAVSPVAALSGVNLLAVEAAGQGWEIVAFAGATLLGPKQWRLTTLVRGMAGSEPFAGIAKAAGARVVLLDGAVQALVAGAESLGRPSFWRVSPAGRDHADAMAVAFQWTPSAEALLPLAPVRLKARRGAGGVTFSWIRRARIGGDSWGVAEVPLGEESESYVVEVLAGAVVKRSITVGTPAWLYAGADEIADFGGPQAILRLRVRQASRAAGPGRAADSVVPVW